MQIKRNFGLKKYQAKIKIIGIGNGGCNIINYISDSCKDDVRVAICDMDKSSLEKSSVPIALQLGKTGLGGGNNSENARKIAEETIEGINELIGTECQIIVVVTCLGGGCGSGVTPVVVRESKKLGLLTISVVTTPFEFEGKQKLQRATNALKEMTKETDAIFVLKNQFILDQNKDTNIFDAFSRADAMMSEAIMRIINLLLEPNIEISKKTKGLKGIEFIRKWFKSCFRKKSDRI